MASIQHDYTCLQTDRIELFHYNPSRSTNFNQLIFIDY